MPYLLIRQRFSDYPTWREAFDSLSDRRGEAGIRTVLVTRNSQEPDEAVVLFEFDDPARVREHVASGALSAAHERGGVIAGSTQAAFLETAPPL